MPGVAPLFLFFILTLNTEAEELLLKLNTMSDLLYFFYSAWLLTLWMGVFNSWTNYYLDVWIVTNRRIITIDQKGFFRRSVSSFKLEKLQDITVEIQGIIATLLDYGSVNAETASHTDEFDARGLPHPREIKSVILRAIDELKRPTDSV